MAKAEFAVKADVSEIENLIDQLKDLQTYKLHQGAGQTLVDLDEVVKIFADHVEAKVVQPEREKGEWIDKSGGIEGAWNYCSMCGERAIDLYDFCPNCGADMRG